MAKLGIVLLILKILGWTVAAVLALVILLLLLVLFVPVRWSIRGDYDESGRGTARASWLGPAVRAGASFETGSGLTYNLRIFSHYLLKHDGAAEESRETKGYRESEEYEDEDTYTGDSEYGFDSEIKGSPEADSESGGVQYSSDTDNSDYTFNETGYEDSPFESEVRKSDKPGNDKKSKKNDTPRASFTDRIIGMVTRARNLWVSFKNRIAGFAGKIKGLRKKRKRITYFLTHETTEYAVKRLKRIILRFLGHLVPGRVKGNLTFGFEDPSLTGRVLGLLCTRYPDWAGKLSLEPVFDHRTFKGDIDISGNIRLIYAAAAALQILCDKRIRVTFGRAKRILSGGH